MQMLITLVISLIFAIGCSHYAKERGRNPRLWFISGLIFGIFALIFLLLLPKKNKKSSNKREEEKPTEPLLIPFLVPLSQTEKFWYYLNADDKQEGPMSFQGLQNAWKDGIITIQSYVWNEELESWKRLSEFIKK